MSTADQLLKDKALCEQILVQFPVGTLFEPYGLEENGTIYKASPVGTLTLAISKGSGNGFEYYFANSFGDVFMVGGQQ